MVVSSVVVVTTTVVLRGPATDRSTGQSSRGAIR
jgi:hypothetical protein